MIPKLPIKVTDGTTTTDINLITVAEGAIGVNGEVDISSGGIAYAVGGGTDTVFQVPNSVGDLTDTIVSVTGVGEVTVGGNLIVDGELTATPAAAESVVIQQAATPTDDIVKIFDSAANKFFSISADGSITINNQGYDPILRINDLNGVQFHVDVANGLVALGNALQLKWRHAGTLVSDVGLARSAAGIVKVTDGGSAGGTVHFQEQTAPAAPAANSVYLYAQDNGAGKTQLMARFATGAAQVVAIEP